MVIEFNPISLDILEDLLGVDYPEYEEGLFGRRADNFCDACRAQYKKRWGRHWPLCEGSVLDGLQDLEKKGMTKDEAMYTRSTLDPVAWAGLTLNWYAEWYQSQYLRCSALAKVCRFGRRTGKCLEEGTLIMTPTGPTPIEQLSVGDEVYAYTVKTDKVSLTKVTAVHDQGIQTVVDLKRQGKTIVSCTPEHRWHTAIGVQSVCNFATEISITKCDQFSVGKNTTEVLSFDLDETREAHCYDISVDTEDNLYLTAGGLVTHNTDALCVDMLHKALTRPGKKEYEAYTVLVITPYEAQVDRIFSVLRNMITRSSSVEESVLADIKNPQSISFTNKSIIKGFTSGVKSGNKSEKIRGEDGDAIYLDESDLLTKDDLEAIIAIQASHPACSINFSTTPTGKRETFHEVCTIKDLGFKEFWRVSHESPRYTEETDTVFRKMYTFGGYQREMLAMFGEEAEGVFQKKYVDASIGTYEMHECVPHQDRMYLMGVDWNDHQHGTHIVINEYDPETEEFRIVAKDIIRGGEYTQLKSIDRIVELNQQWMPTYIGLDAGYGTTNEELLKIIGAKYPQTGLKEKMFAYNMSSKVIVKDAITGADLKKHIKPLMVEWSVQIMERGLQKFPASEDSKKGKGLVHQVRSYRKERVSPDGRPVYSQGYDHTLTAWNLTLLVFMLNETEFANSSRMVQFTRSGRPDKDGKINNSGKEVPKKQLRLFGAKRGGLVPTGQTVRADLKSMRKALRPTKRSNF
jgi:hypothetical protein